MHMMGLCPSMHFMQHTYQHKHTPYRYTPPTPPRRKAKKNTPAPHGTRSKPPLHPKLYIGSRYGYIRGKHMSQHHYETRIMNAWYAYNGPMSFEQFYATYIPA